MAKKSASKTKKATKSKPVKSKSKAKETKSKSKSKSYSAATHKLVNALFNKNIDDLVILDYNMLTSSCHNSTLSW